MSIMILGLIVNMSAFSDLAFADKSNKEEKKNASEKEPKPAKAEKEPKPAKAEKKVKEFGDNAVVTSSSTTTICHIPPGNPANNHTITIGNSAVSAHLGHGDRAMPCEDVNWEDFETSSNEDPVNGNENAIEQIRKQIDNLQKQLQKLLGL